MVFSSSLFKEKFLSAVLSTIAALSTTIKLSSTKFLEQEISTSFSVFITSCFSLLLLMPFLFINKKMVFRTKVLHLHCLRAIFSVSTLICTYYAYRNLPISFATSVGMSGPLFSIVLSVIFFKEKIGFKKCIIIFLGYVGVIILIRPDNIFINLSTISIILATILASTILIIVKFILRTDSILTNMLYTNVSNTIVALIFSINEWQPITMENLLILFIIGFLSATIQVCTIIALKYSQPSFVAPFEYTRLVFAITIGFIVFDERVDFYTILGGVIIIASIYLLTFSNKRNTAIYKGDL